MKSLRAQVDREGLGDRVRTALITYDSELDTSEQLRLFGEARGLSRSDRLLLLWAHQERLQKIIDGLEVPVNFNADRVNTHGLALFLLDKEGRVARRYHTLIWDNSLIIKDLKRLTTEGSAR